MLVALVIWSASQRSTKRITPVLVVDAGSITPHLHRPAWYPFKARPPGRQIVPVGNVRMTKADASELFLHLFTPFMEYALTDPDEFLYVREGLVRFREATLIHDPVIVAASPHYHMRSIAVPASTHRSIRHPGKVVITFYMPLWAEYDHFFVTEYVRNAFIATVTHELEHVDEGFWRRPTVSREEKVYDEALVWARSCERLILPMMQRDRDPGLHTRGICEEYRIIGSHPPKQVWVDYIRRMVME